MKTDTYKNTHKHDIEILSVKEAALFLKKSESWVYQNYKEIGGRKIKGALFLPCKEEIYERLFCESEKFLEVRIPAQQKTVYESRVQDQKRSPGRGSRKKKGGEEPDTGNRQDRHGLFRVG